MVALYDEWRRTRRRKEDQRSSAIWGKFPMDLDKPYPDDLLQEMRADQAWDDLRQAWHALRALWGPAIRHRPRDSSKGWTVYDGHIRARQEELTTLRAVAATIGILLGLRVSDEVRARWSRRHGRSACWAPSYGMAFWDCHCDGYGHSSMCLQLGPGLHVEIFSDGESFL